MKKWFTLQSHAMSLCRGLVATGDGNETLADAPAVQNTFDKDVTAARARSPVAAAGCGENSVDELGKRKQIGGRGAVTELPATAAAMGFDAAAGCAG